MTEIHSVAMSCRRCVRCSCLALACCAWHATPTMRCSHVLSPRILMMCCLQHSAAFVLSTPMLHSLCCKALLLNLWPDELNAETIRYRYRRRCRQRDQ